MIALLSTLDKAMELVLASRVSCCVEKYRLLPDYYIGGRKARSTEVGNGYPPYPRDYPYDLG